MKFSEFLNYSKQGPVQVPVESVPISPLPESLPKKAEPKSSSHDLSMGDASAIERRVREELNEQFQKQLQLMRAQMEEQYRQQFDLEKMKLSFQEERAKQTALFEQEKKMQEQSREFLEYKKQMENSLAAALESERQKLRASFEEEMQKTARALEGFQKLLEVREKEIYEAKKQLADFRSSAAPTEPVTNAEPVVKKNIPPPIVKIPRDQLHETTVLPEKSSSSLRPIEKKEEKLPLVILHHDPQADAAAHALRDQLIQVGEEIFDAASHQHPLDLSTLRSVISSFIAMIHKRDLEVMRLALEIYPEGKHFTIHSVNVTILALVLGLEFSFSNEEMMDLGLAAFLHDLGLVNIREDLNYPKKLTPQLEQEILNHPMRGAEMVKDLLNPPALDAIRQHHEIGNGKGYPKGLAESDIHIFASILHVVDSFEALIHERPYRKIPLEVNEAMKQLIDTGRGVYDRNVLKALMIRVGLFPVMSYVELSNKQIGCVVLQNRQYPLSPVVQLEYDENGNKLPKTILVDLSQSQFIHISGPVKKTVEEGHTSSRFASTLGATAEESRKGHSKSEKMDFIQHVISVVLILTVLAILVYVIIKI